MGNYAHANRESPTAKCDVCGWLKEYKSPIAAGMGLREHFRWRHWDTMPNKDLLDCHFCECKLNSFALLAEHVKTVHGDAPPQENTIMAEYRPPEPEATEDGSFAPFLKPEDLGKGQVKAKILSVRETSDLEFSDFALDVKIGANTYTMGVRINRPNHRSLMNVLGKGSWKGQTITLESKYSKKYKKDFVAVIEPRRK